MNRECFFRRWAIGLGLLFFCMLCLFGSRIFTKKIDSMKAQHLAVSFSVQAGSAERSTTLFGLEDASLSRLVKRIAVRGAEAQNIRIYGFLKVEETTACFFSLNANRSARLFVDGQEIVQSSVFEKDQSLSASLELEKGLHTFSLRFVPSGEGSYLQILWKKAENEKFRTIPPENLFSPWAADLTQEELEKIQANTRTAVFFRSNAVLLFWLGLGGFFLFVLKTIFGKRLFPAPEKKEKHSSYNRLSDIDKTKGLAGFLMIMVHLDGANLFPFGAFGASLFFICSGMNTILFIERSRSRKNFNLYQIFFVVLLFFGGITQIRIVHPERILFVPEFLQVSALSMLLILLLSKRFKNIRYVGFLFPLPFLLHGLYQQGWLSFVNTWPRISGFLFGSAAFPLFPWSGFFLFGVFLLWMRESRLRLFGIFVLSGLLSLISVFVLRIPVEKFNMSLSYILFSLSTSAFWFWLFNGITKTRWEGRLRRLMIPLEVIGRNSLMFVYVHYFALAYIPLREFVSLPLYMLLWDTLIAYLFCVFCVFYYERSKQDSTLFLPALLMFGLLVLLQYGGYLSVWVDVKLISILVGLLFAFLYVQLRWKLRIFLHPRPDAVSGAF